MKTLRTLLLLTIASVSVNAQQDPLQHYLVPPHIIMRKADDVGLTEEQRRKIQEAVQQAHKRNEGKSPALSSAVESLGESLKLDKIPMDSAKEKLDSVVDAERVVKHIHLEMLISVNNILTTEQRTTLLKFHAAHTEEKRNHDTLREKLTAKVERVQKGIQAKVQAGEQPFEIVELMHGFPKLMELGKIDEAEAILDKALKLLGDDGGEEPESATEDPPTPPTSFKTPEEIQSAIASLRVEDVAWRKIEWKTCLLDGLRASREQNKPIILWVFIDRPVDDKRC
tara:strand:- start:210 stop:1058 length:849 start_codon:yes stop_codon:yes gene_type:complete